MPNEAGVEPKVLRLVFLMKNPKLDLSVPATLVEAERVDQFFPDWKSWIKLEIDREKNLWRISHPREALREPWTAIYHWEAIGTSSRYAYRNSWFFGVYDRDNLEHMNRAMYTAVSEREQTLKSLAAQ